MHSRIAPHDNTRPKHQIERGYLNDLAAAIKVAFHKIEGGGWRPLSLEMLHEWDTTHRYALVTCSEWFFPREGLGERSKHEKEIAFVDMLLVKIRAGFHDGDPVAYVTLSHIEQLELAHRAVGVCKTQLVYY